MTMQFSFGFFRLVLIVPLEANLNLCPLQDACRELQRQIDEFEWNEIPRKEQIIKEKEKAAQGATPEERARNEKVYSDEQAKRSSERAKALREEAQKQRDQGNLDNAKGLERRAEQIEQSAKEQDKRAEDYGKSRDQLSKELEELNKSLEKLKEALKKCKEGSK